MLTDLLKQRLEPYKKPLILVVVFQTIQAFAALTLPSLNADIIDKGVIPGDNAEIWLDRRRDDGDDRRADRVRHRGCLLRGQGRHELRS